MTACIKKPIGELCSLINGRAFKPSEWRTEGLPIIRIQNLNDHNRPFNRYCGTVAQKFLVHTGDILLSWSGTPGTSFGCFRWQRGSAVLNQHIFRVVLDETLMDPDYFVHAVNSTLERLIELAHGGVGLRHITKEKLEGVELPVPSLLVQHRVVSQIGHCMVRIDEAERLRKASIREVDALGAALIEEQMSTVCGDEVSLGDVCTIESRLVDPRDPTVAPMIHVGGANIESGTGRIVNAITANQEKLTSGKFLFGDQDVLYNKIRPYLRKVARPDFAGICSADMYPLRPSLDRMSRGFLFYLLLSRDFTGYAVTVSNRAGMPKVNRKDLFAYKFRLPTLAAQLDIVDVLDEATGAVRSLRSNLNSTAGALSEMRRAVLRRSFNSEE